jgi:hypothetical protein
MDLKPIKEYRSPDFPELGDVRKKQGFLNQFMPEKWQRNLALTGAALLLFAGSPAFGKDVVSIPKSGGVQIAQTGTPAPRDWGRTAGVVAVPRSYVTEAEAKKMITDAFAKNKISFDKQNYKVESKEHPGAMVLDGYSTASNVGYKILKEQGWKEVNIWVGETNKCFTTNKAAAEFLEKELWAKNKLRCIVVYIPEYDVNKENSVKKITIQINKFLDGMKSWKHEKE